MKTTEMVSNQEKMYALLEKADALRYDGIVIRDWALMDKEELEEILTEDEDENPIILSMYHFDNNGLQEDFYFDLSDVNDGILDNNMKLTAADGHTLEMLFAFRAEVKEEAVEVVKPEPLHIIFGETPSSYSSFEFETEAEKIAFANGLNEMDGWLAYMFASDADESTLKTLKVWDEEAYDRLKAHLSKEVA